MIIKVNIPVKLRRVVRPSDSSSIAALQVLVAVSFERDALILTGDVNACSLLTLLPRVANIGEVIGINIDIEAI